MSSSTSAGHERSQDQAREDIIEPNRPICDAHHHLWDSPRERYLLREFLEDIGSGHRIVSSIFVEAGSFYRQDGPSALQPVGEVEFANGIAAAAASGRYGEARVSAGIVAFTELRLGDEVEPVLAALENAGNGRLRGIRQTASWDSDPRIHGGRFAAPPGLYLDSAFRDGFRVLRHFDLVFDAFVYHPQLGDVLDLARAFPSQTIVLDHMGGLLGIGPYAGKHDDFFGGWKTMIQKLAACPNVFLKLGGLGMTRCGFGFHKLEVSVDSAGLADSWRAWIETGIEAFGPERCMFESNFPVDRPSCSYAVLWNAFKRLVSGASTPEKDLMFQGTAERIYKLGQTSEARSARPGQERN